MKTTVDEYEFKEAFRRIRPDNFTYKGLSAFFDSLEELESDMGEELELDVIGLCCDYSEYESLLGFAHEYFSNDVQGASECGFDDDDDDDEKEQKIREYIQDNGQLIEFEGGIIVSAF
jgi:hypothetical protein